MSDQEQIKAFVSDLIEPAHSLIESILKKHGNALVESINDLAQEKKALRERAEKAEHRLLTVETNLAAGALVDDVLNWLAEQSKADAMLAERRKREEPPND